MELSFYKSFIKENCVNFISGFSPLDTCSAFLEAVKSFSHQPFCQSQVLSLMLCCIWNRYLLIILMFTYTVI